MAYKLTLTKEERRAFDWIGDRYNNGDAMSDILNGCMGEDDEWSQDGDITFNIPEHKAWEIHKLAFENTDGGHSMWPCFARDLSEKMDTFIDSIV